MKGLLTLTLTLFLATVCVPLAFAADEIAVMVAPDTIVLEEGVDEHVLTVHAEISYYSVTGVKLYDGPIEYNPYITFPDNKGELVAKFSIPAGNLEEGPLTLKLLGTTDGDTFSGSDTISVIEKNDGGPDPSKPQNKNGNREGQQG
ncbi:MAG: hypothetical protein JSW23_06515 [Planctomycetota bacterium]|nr:MAG: hypothetical protein JSW23_06515 [Planctomycetota bacterium]